VYDEVVVNGHAMHDKPHLKDDFEDGIYDEEEDNRSDQEKFEDNI